MKEEEEKEENQASQHLTSVRHTGKK